jgi:hypothetical protein
VRSATQFADSLGQKHPDFELVRGIANASKHFERRPDRPGRAKPPGMPSHAANVYLSGIAFQRGAFQAFQTGSVKLQKNGSDIEFAGIAESVLDMWNKIIADEGW